MLAQAPTTSTEMLVAQSAAPVAPVVPQAAETTEVMGSAPSKFNPKILLGVVAAVVVAGAVYFGMGVVNTPARVKEQVMPTHQVFGDYNRAVKKVFEDLASDDEVKAADAVERAVQKSEELANSAKTLQTQLRELLDDLNISQAENYKMALEEYDQAATQAIEMQMAMVSTFKGYVEVARELETLEVEFSGIAQYLYSDPNKFVEAADEMITKMESVERRLNDIDAKSPFIDTHKNMIQGITDQIVLLKDMRDGVKNRSIEKIGEASQKYTEASQKTSNEEERLRDKLEDDIENLSDQAEDAAQKAEREYQNLQTEYKF